MNIKPLSGIKILDLTRLLPGPLCTLHLADLGADVIKIEDTAAGDYARHAPPMQKNMSTLFLALNRNKRSLVLDLSKEEGKKIFRKLSEKADVIVESFRPDVMKKFRLDYEEIKKINRKIIYCSITGYGHSGPNKNKAGHDLNFVAESGALHLPASSRHAKNPSIPNFQIADILGGTLNAAMGILAAIIHRDKTGEGQFIDVSIFDGLLAHSVIALSHLNSKETLGFDSSGMLCGDMHCYNIYETSDNRFLGLAALEYKFWQRFCMAANKPEWLSKHISFGKESHEMAEELSLFFRKKTLADWMEFFKDADCCISPVATLKEALDSEQARSGNILLHQHHPTEGMAAQFSFPLKFSNLHIDIERPAPVYGEHTEEILREHGFSEEDILLFKNEKVTV